jgi:hypothetical protein
VVSIDFKIRKKKLFLPFRTEAINLLLHYHDCNKIIFRTVDTDDYRGDCDDKLNFDTFSDFRPKPKVRLNIPKRLEKNFPLLRTLNDAIVITLDEMQQEKDLEKENEIDRGNQQNQNQNDKKEPSSSCTIVCSFVSLFFATVVLKLL